jgi:hypothetical protein
VTSHASALNPFSTRRSIFNASFEDLHQYITLLTKQSIKRKPSSNDTTSIRNHLSQGSHSTSNLSETLTLCADHVSLSARANSTLSPDHAIAISPLSSASCAHSQTPLTARSSVPQQPSPPTHGISGGNCPRYRKSLAPAFPEFEPATLSAFCRCYDARTPCKHHRGIHSQHRSQLPEYREHLAPPTTTVPSVAPAAQRQMS